MPADNLSLDDLSAIMNLQRQEAFDDIAAEPDTETPEEKLMKIVKKPLPGLSRRKEDILKRAQNARRASNDHRYSSGSMSMSDMGFKMNDDEMEDSEKQEWRRAITRSRSSADEDLAPRPTDLRRVSSTASGNRAGRPPSSNKRRSYARGTSYKRSSSFKSLSLIETTRSDLSGDSSATGEKRGKRPSKFRYEASSTADEGIIERNPPRNISLSNEEASVGTTDSKSMLSISSVDTSELDKKFIRAGSLRSLSTAETGKIESDRSYASQQNDSQRSSAKRRSISRDRTTQGSKRTSTRKSKAKRRMSSRDPESRRRTSSRSVDPERRRRSGKSADPESRRRTRSSSRPRPDEGKQFEDLWGSEEKSSPMSAPRHSDNEVAGGGSSLIKNTGTFTEYSSTKKKTKLEKIHELNAKCDRYKKEWIDASKEKKKIRKELQDVRIDVVSLNMEIETHKTETDILRRQLTDALQKLDETQDEQRKERNEYSETAKELAQARIDFTKSLNEAREIRLEMDKLEGTIREKDRQIDSMREELDGAKKIVEELKQDLSHADDEGIRMEREIKKIEEDLVLYKEAAEKDEGESGAGNLQRVHSDMEQKHSEEREQRIEEKQRKLDEKLRKLEIDKERSLKKQKEREQEFAQRQLAESEKEQAREEERKGMDNAINSRLKELETNNTVLQGKMKSEQLETTVKLKKRDETILELQKALAEVKKQLSERDADPEGLTILQRDIESAKSETFTVKEDLEEAQRLNGMLQEEIDDLQTGGSELEKELSALREQTSSSTTEIEKLRKKSSDWERKSGEWTDRAFQWKEKAEYWEKTAREIDPYYKEGSNNPTTPRAEDPQALFLHAAAEKKKKAAAASPGTWKTWGGLFNNASVDQTELQNRLQELEDDNANQADTIKTLRSDIVRIQSSHKEEAYNSQQLVLQVKREMQAVEMNNASLLKQLELARKLEHFAAQDLTTTL